MRTGDGGRAAAGVYRADVLVGGAAGAGDTLAGLAGLFHLMRRRVLTADLGSAPLGPSSLVWLQAGEQ